METSMNDKLDLALKKEFRGMEISGPANGLDAFMAKIPKPGLPFIGQVMIFTASVLAVAISGICISNAQIGQENHADSGIFANAINERSLMTDYTFKPSLIENTNVAVAGMEPVYPTFVSKNTETATSVSAPEQNSDESRLRIYQAQPTESDPEVVTSEPQHRLIYDTVHVNETIMVHDTVITKEQHRVSLRNKRKNTR
ncbi:MAG TPA: hypothetical protein PLZ52_11450 [Bacteroidales bacterium]|nr:hypothetical protein [Bacteroidales bacterium]HQL70438.1 hypothetical protein [Bacteroidales bacterium]